MKKSLFLTIMACLMAVSTAFAHQEYANSPDDPGVDCSQCHNDGRTWSSSTTEPPVVESSPPPTDSSLSFTGATYDGQTGTLTMPTVAVDGKYYSASLVMTQAFPTPLFGVDELSEVGAVDTPSAYFVTQGGNGALVIPNCLVGDMEYAVVLGLEPSLFEVQFTVVDAGPTSDSTYLEDGYGYDNYYGGQDNYNQDEYNDNYNDDNYNDDNYYDDNYYDDNNYDGGY